MPEINFHVTRFNPESDPAPYVKTYKIAVREGMTVLEGLHYIKDNVDPTLAWRYSCRMGVCGSCGMLLNGRLTLATDARYVRPMPLTAAQRYNEDTRDDWRRERNQVTGSAHGAFRCHYAGECSRACPKGVDPAKAIQHLKRRLVLDYLHLARRRRPCEKLHGPGHGTPLPNIPAAPARTV
jgi:succinate dehydrogenase/fumarate reductase-like Fe-S protein